jgi:hypothetical protein
MGLVQPSGTCVGATDGLGARLVQTLGQRTQSCGEKLGQKLWAWPDAAMARGAAYGQQRDALGVRA